MLITARDVSDRVALRRQLTQLTYHDGLTGLPNRAYVEERVRDLAQGPGTEAAGGSSESPGDDPWPEEAVVAGVILVDFDGYAAVNETAGHAGGRSRPRAGRPAAARCRAAGRYRRRWGGDEFAVLLGPDAPELGVAATRQEIIELAERLAGLIAAEPFSVADKEIALTASVGVPPSPRLTSQGTVLANAETALAKAQEAGVGRVEIFAPAMHAEADAGSSLPPIWAAAIADQELEIEYLPVIDLSQLADPRRRGGSCAGLGTPSRSRLPSSSPSPRSRG